MENNNTYAHKKIETQKIMLELPKTTLLALNKIAHQKGLSRTALIKITLEMYIRNQYPLAV